MPSKSWLLAVLALAAIPQPAEACGPLPEWFLIDDVWPVADATQVPTDGVIVVRGLRPEVDTEVVIAVEVGGESVAGAVIEATEDRVVWRADAPFEPNTEYAVHIESLSAGEPSEVGDSRDLTFVTGDAPAPAAPPASVVTAELEIVESTIECLDNPSCCMDPQVVEIPATYLLHLDIAAPVGVFDGFYRAEAAVGPSLDALVEEQITIDQQTPGQEMKGGRFIGLVSEWQSEQICYRVDLVDLFGQKTAGEPACLAVEGPDEDVTESAGDTSGGASETAGDTSGGASETESDGGAGEDDVEKGCACRSDPSGDGSGLLVALGLLSLRPGRRRFGRG